MQLESAQRAFHPEAVHRPDRKRLVHGPKRHRSWGRPMRHSCFNIGPNLTVTQVARDRLDPCPRRFIYQDRRKLRWPSRQRRRGNGV